MISLHMASTHSNIVLIGMPGAGKSSVGVILAKMISYQFIDTDIAIQARSQCSLQDIIDQQGYQALRQIEEDVLLSLNLQKHVISTGGSAVYSAAAMQHLKQSSSVVFLEVDIPTLEKRIGDFAQRGIAMQPGQSFADLFAERSALYTQYADITIAASQITPEEVCQAIIRQ